MGIPVGSVLPGCSLVNKGLGEIDSKNAANSWRNMNYYLSEPFYGSDKQANTSLKKIQIGQKISSAEYTYTYYKNHNKDANGHFYSLEDQVIGMYFP